MNSFVEIRFGNGTIPCGNWCGAELRDCGFVLHGDRNGEIVCRSCASELDASGEWEGIE